MNASHHTSRLIIEFQGGFQCRLATDPDPTRETRGVSGYTYALAGESNLDQIIHLQGDRIPQADYRTRGPLNSLPKNDDCKDEFGVRVTRTRLVKHGDEAGDETCPQLNDARVDFLDKPVFASWNQIVADGVQRIATPIYPFEIQIQKDDWLLRRFDPLTGIPGVHTPIEDLEFDQYQRRIPIYNRPSDEVLKTLIISDPNGYFQQRKERMQLELAVAQEAKDQVAISNFETRLKTIDYYTQGAEPGGKVAFLADRLALQSIWEHSINGENATVQGDFGYDIDRQAPWHTRFWMGGWDGDVMRGYVKGWLAVPIE